MQNDMRDRLVELLGKELLDYASWNTEMALAGNYNMPSVEEVIADKLIANGVIVPPCKVGDTVYCINTIFSSDPRINECEVDALHITSGKNNLGHKKPSYALVRDKNMKSLSSRLYFEDFGKTVFLTKDQAEQKLKELSENG